MCKFGNIDAYREIVGRRFLRVIDDLESEEKERTKLEKRLASLPPMFKPPSVRVISLTWQSVRLDLRRDTDHSYRALTHGEPELLPQVALKEAIRDLGRYTAKEANYIGENPPQSEVDSTKDPGYASGPKIGSSREYAQTIALQPMDASIEQSDELSIRSLSGLVDFGEDRRLWSISTFALKIVDSLSSDICNVVHDREEARFVIQEALESLSYSSEQEGQFSRLSPELQAATFVRQQNA
ncbi:hypothetical protein LTR95_011699 [Oleoguttula sp. CCFEE 5521]